VGIRGAWVPARGLGTPLVPTWRLGYNSLLGTSLRTHDAWTPASVLGTPCAHVVLGLLPVGWALPSAHVPLRLRWVSHNRALLGISGVWVIGRASRSMINGSSVRTHSIGSFIKTQCSWVLGF